MKTFLRKTAVMLAAVAMLLPVGCTQTEEAPEAPHSKQTFKVKIGGPETRVAFDDQGSAGVKLTWTTGDKLIVFNSGTEYVATLTLISDGGSAEGEFEIEGDGYMDERYSYSVHYPYIDGVTNQDEYTEALFNKLSSPSTQQGTTMDHLSDICWMSGAKSQDTELFLEHQLPMFTVKMTAPTDIVSGEVPTDLTLIIDNYQTMKVNLEGGDWTTPVYLFVTANTPSTLKFDVTTSAGNTYTYTKDISDKEYKGGKRYTADISGLLTKQKEAYFPDAELRKALKALVPNLVEENGDIDPTSDVNKALIENVKTLNVSNKGLTSLKGIEYFTALTILNCYKNSLTDLDVSKNINLTTLSCQTNSLTALDVSKNTKLIKLTCNSNLLTALNLSENVSLTNLACTGNLIDALDLSKNVNLTTVYCDKNSLTALDLSKNEKLTGINCNNNQIETSTLTLPTTTTSLLYLMCSDNKLTSLDISAYTGLKQLECDGNQISSLDVSKHTELTTLHCFDNRLSTLDITTLTKLDMNTGGSNLFFSCGKQKDENGGARTLTLTVTDAQKTEFETSGVYDVENNSGVTLSVKN